MYVCICRCLLQRIYAYATLWIYSVYNIPNWLLLVLLLIIFSHPPKRFDPNNNWGDMACCMYLGNAYTSIPMLLAELKCILLTAKKKDD